MMASVDLELVQARQSDRDVVGQLLEFNSYEFSRIDGRSISRNGRYGYRYLDAYWSEPGRVPYLLRAGGELAGLVLVWRCRWPDEAEPGGWDNFDGYGAYAALASAMPTAFNAVHTPDEPRADRHRRESGSIGVEHDLLGDGFDRAVGAGGVGPRRRGLVDLQERVAG